MKYWRFHDALGLPFGQLQVVSNSYPSRCPKRHPKGSPPPRLQVAQFAQALGDEPRELVVTQAEMASAGAMVPMDGYLGWFHGK